MRKHLLRGGSERGGLGGGTREARAELSFFFSSSEEAGEELGESGAGKCVMGQQEGAEVGGQEKREKQEQERQRK